MKLNECEVFGKPNYHELKQQETKVSISSQRQDTTDCAVSWRDRVVFHVLAKKDCDDETSEVSEFILLCQLH